MTDKRFRGYRPSGPRAELFKLRLAFVAVAVGATFLLFIIGRAVVTGQLPILSRRSEELLLWVASPAKFGLYLAFCVILDALLIVSLPLLVQRIREVRGRI